MSYWISSISRGLRFVKRLLRVNFQKEFKSCRDNPKSFIGSTEYWENRYAAGGDSGLGSYDLFAEFKANFLNSFVQIHDIESVIEFGCGDGNQLKLAQYPKYLGFDVSKTAIEKCNELFKSEPDKAFELMENYNNEKADLVISLDVIYHLVENEIFEEYMHILFQASDRYVIIYSSNQDEPFAETAAHVKHRKFTDWVSRCTSEWDLIERIANQHPYRGDYRTGSFADFYVYKKA